MTRPPLDGLRIVAVDQFGAGPFGTQLLAEAIHLGVERIDTRREQHRRLVDSPRQAVEP